MFTGQGALYVGLKEDAFKLMFFFKKLYLFQCIVTVHSVGFHKDNFFQIYHIFFKDPFIFVGYMSAPFAHTPL